ncbi:hypothetical protein [Candidatus Nanopusillus massiliensis]|uniref:hypothetical protein n=1 Tax=Candidatus Nanopusillus massiliensis TaxID=2897163 RepID=UPI001E33B505|nr:hypothetical protein [Candidatus Nanopusillus massiliensis]
MAVNISKVSVVKAIEYEKYWRKKMRVIIKDVIPERKVIAQVLENDIYIFK